MKKFVIRRSPGVIAVALIALSLLAGCLRSPAERIKKHLLTSMETFLNNSSPGGKKARFEVLDVNYYDDKINYQCEFRVRMHENGKDTIGTMAAQVSRDFRQIKRRH